MRKTRHFVAISSFALFFLTACVGVNIENDVVYGKQATLAIEEKFGIGNFAPPSSNRWEKLKCDFSHKDEGYSTSVSLCFVADSRLTAHLYLFRAEEYLSDDVFISNMFAFTSNNQIIGYEALQSFEKTVSSVNVQIVEIQGRLGLIPYRPYFSIATFRLKGYKFAILIGNGKGTELKDKGVKNLNELLEVLNRLSFS